jgi:hypothetical protein
MAHTTSPDTTAPDITAPDITTPDTSSNDLVATRRALCSAAVVTLSCGYVVLLPV